MNQYELALVVNARLEDEVRVAAVEKVKEYITRFGGTVANVDEWGKRRLAYEINKIKEGYYYFIAFESEPGCPEEVENRLRIMEPVLRYLVTRKEA